MTLVMHKYQVISVKIPSSNEKDNTARLEIINSKISALEKLLETPKAKSIYLLKIDDRYFETVDMTSYEIDADDERECFTLSDVGEINSAMHFDKNAAHRTKYFVDFHHHCQCEMVDLHSELLMLIERKKFLISFMKQTHPS